MAHIIKKGPIKVPTQPKDFDLQATGLVFKSYDNQIALEFNVAQQDGTPADLLGANLRLLMFIYDEVDGTIKKEPIPFITKNLITESFLNGHVVYILPEAMKAYNGMVEAYVYIEYPDGSTSDNLGFTFRMKRSAIDGLAQDKADYFIEDFKQLLAAASLEANKVIEGLDTEIKNLQQATKDANAAVDGAMDRIDGLEAEIGQLERLREMYIDTLDFGGYDYSGNPNLMANINADSFSQGSGALSVVDDGDEVVITLDPNHKLEVLKPKSQPALLTGKTYTVSVEIMLEGDFTGDPSKIGLRYIKMPNWVSELYTRNTLTATKGVWQKLTGTVKITAASDNAESWLIMLQNKDANNSLSGKLRLRHAKLEEGSTATPYQPNLLAEPYNMCPEYPNENIVNPTVKFPIKT
ncbi:TPA: BppU family phage baseplate upper protein, partial [Enterococcus faecium]|nr:BppU family phage baseplate upper protein [Enterococcus faecium]HAQ7254658.1 BppU family phage baseplate upper protein [Enterococcus faecium]HAQ7352022.1 BppU family phage baseplate upper protein [Enterococcus faecium]HAQ7494529.1 BppU family phage baseplate upper protein [Enterococcus faecium]HAQ7832102.1 BppU family phage baseplate upper protein [Enterococcus faecium]